VASFILLLVLLAVLIAFEVVRELYIKDGDAKGVGEVVFSQIQISVAIFSALTFQIMNRDLALFST
ncbi:hypothetical protein CPB84DRAFT_1793892, partial [Gymnopilus junonius]